MANAECIARLLTAASPGAIAVIALAGPRARAVLRAATRRRAGDAAPDFPDNRIVYCRVVDGDETIDDALAVAWDGGAAAELCLHGGVRVVQRAMLLLERLGARQAQEAARANNEVEDEIDAALLKAETRHMTRWLLAQRRLLPAFLSEHAGSGVDAATARRAEVAAKLVRGLHVAIIGPPNAGKSTLANRLIGRERVITSDRPGTTRDWVSETATVGGWPITLTDTAGIRHGGDALEREAIARGTSVARRADLALIVLDATRNAGDLDADRDRSQRSIGADVAKLVVLNKLDRLPAAARQAPWPAAIGISALSGEGIVALEAAIIRRLGLELLTDDVPTPITVRQIALLGGLPSART